jgi:chorismate mutase-like protein
MPAVAAYKRLHGLPIEAPAREAVVLQQAMDSAAAAGLDAQSVRTLFVEQMALAKALQTRAAAVEPMDLDAVLRPALSALDKRILDALAASAGELRALRADDLDLLVPLLEADERARLLAALRAVRLAPARSTPTGAPRLLPGPRPSRLGTGLQAAPRWSARPDRRSHPARM